MTTAKPIKCASKDLTSGPFYLVQSNGEKKRFVASFRDKEAIRAFLLVFIDKAENKLEIKIRDLDDQENPMESGGQVTKQKFKEAIEKYEEVIFHDGYHDLMIRLPGSMDYVAFDEHGLIYIYSQENYAGILSGLNLQYAPAEKLIYEYAHWHYRPANGREDLKKLIHELGLQ